MEEASAAVVEAGGLELEAGPDDAAELLQSCQESCESGGTASSGWTGEVIS